MTVPTPEMLEFLKLYVAHFEAGSGVEVLLLITGTPTVDYTIRAKDTQSCHSLSCCLQNN